MRVVKLTDRDGYSRRGLPGETLWLPVGREVKPTGEGSDQCGPGVLHYFASEVEASLYWPTYLLDESAARALSVEVESVETDGIKRNNVIIETTHTRYGCLEQGGICGRRVAYALADVERATGLTRAQLAAAGLDDCAPGSHRTLRELIEYNAPGRVIRRGHRIH